MVVAFGKVSAFNPTQDEWHCMSKDWDMFSLQMGLPQNPRSEQFFLSVISASNYKLLSSLIAQNKPGNKEYSQLVEKISEHFAPAPSEIVERFKFHTRF